MECELLEEETKEMSKQGSDTSKSSKICLFLAGIQAALECPSTVSCLESAFSAPAPREEPGGSSVPAPNSLVQMPGRERGVGIASALPEFAGR